MRNNLQLLLFSNFLGESNMVLGGLHHLVELVGRTTLLLILGSLLLLSLFLGLLLLVVISLFLSIFFVLLLLLLLLLGLLFLAICSLFLLSGLLLGSHHLVGHLLHVGHLTSISGGLLLVLLLILAGLALLLGRLLDLLGSLLYLLDRLLRGLLSFLKGLIQHFIVGLNAVLDLRELAALSRIFLAGSLAQGSVVVRGRVDINLSLQAGRTNTDGFGSLLSQREAG